MTRMFVLLSVLLFPLVSAQSQDTTDPYRVYFGNLHSHTSYSDGSGTPAEAFAYARDVGKLDFMAVTEHNHAGAEAGAKERRDGLMIATNRDLYSGTGQDSVISAAKQHTENGKFVALAGQEFSTISKGNHVNAFEITSVIQASNGDFGAFFRLLAETPDSVGQPAVIMLNHPGDHEGRDEYGQDDFASRATWLQTLDKHARLIEVLSGPAMAKRSGNRPRSHAERDYLNYLNLGLHLAPSGSQDNHYKTWGTATDVRTAVLATELTKEKVLDALRSRRAYATHDKNLRVWFRLGEYLMGDEAEMAASSTTTAQVTIQDDDEPGATYRIDLLWDTVGGRTVASAVANKTLSGNGTVKFDGVRYRGGAEYFLVKITQTNGRRPKDLTWTAPIWLKPAR